MMKKNIVILAAAVLTVLAGCNLKNTPPVPYEEPVDPTVERDSTIYGFCGEGSTPNVLKLVDNATQDTMSFEVYEARRAGKLLGEYHVGDQLYVVPSADRRHALVVVNENLLVKDWVMPSPYDGSSPVGVSLKSGGEAQSIDQIDLVYTRWSILNGRLLLTETREDAGGLELTQKYDILKLTNDQLNLSNVDESETFEFTVKKDTPEENLGIELDYDTEEDFDLGLF